MQGLTMVRKPPKYARTNRIIGIGLVLDSPRRAVAGLKVSATPLMQ